MPSMGERLAAVLLVREMQGMRNGMNCFGIPPQKNMKETIGDGLCGSFHFSFPAYSTSKTFPKPVASPVFDDVPRVVV